MSLRHTLAAAAAIAFCISAAPASADVLATLEFTQPTGTVGPNDPVEVWVKLTLDPDSDPVVFDAGNGVQLNDSLLPATGWYYDEQNQFHSADFVSYDATNTWTMDGYRCGGNFLNLCSGNQSYQFEWNPHTNKPWFGGRLSLDLKPGDSMTYLFGTFVPRAGGADPGTYSFTSALAGFMIYGWSADSRYIQAFVTLAETCPGNSCSFTREVLAVPEPGTYVMMSAGTMLLAWVARRRRRR